MDRTLYCLFLFFSYIGDSSEGLRTQEYCNSETFSPTCGDKDVIMIQQARYGRMKTGRCIRENYGHMGCYADVTKILEEKCSGKQKCSVPVLDSDLHASPCSKEFTSYLDVKYACVPDCPVLEPPNGGEVYLRGLFAKIECRRTGEVWMVVCEDGQWSENVPSECEGEESTTETGLRTQEYCNWETFSPTCGDNDVIMIQQARYGRMKTGRCIRMNYGFIGCSADVKVILEAKCSGKQECSVMLPDSDLHSLTKCPEDLTSYLEVTYSCVPGCPALEPPTGGEVRIRGFTAIIECRSTGHVWSVVCERGQWSGGVPSKCPGEESTAETGRNGQ